MYEEHRLQLQHMACRAPRVTGSKILLWEVWGSMRQQGLLPLPNLCYAAPELWGYTQRFR